MERAGFRILCRVEGGGGSSGCRVQGLSNIGDCKSLAARARNAESCFDRSFLRQVGRCVRPSQNQPVGDDKVKERPAPLIT